MSEYKIDFSNIEYIHVRYEGEVNSNFTLHFFEGPTMELESIDSESLKWDDGKMVSDIYPEFAEILHDLHNHVTLPGFNEDVVCEFDVDADFNVTNLTIESIEQ